MLVNPEGCRASVVQRAPTPGCLGGDDVRYCDSSAQWSFYLFGHATARRGSLASRGRYVRMPTVNGIWTPHSTPRISNARVRTQESTPPRQGLGLD
jgi:hypothetical protein